jgi:hypothetical protein
VFSLVDISNRRITGLSGDVRAQPRAEVGTLGRERHLAKLAARPRRRAVGAGAKPQLVFADRLFGNAFEGPGAETGQAGRGRWRRTGQHRT